MENLSYTGQLNKLTASFLRRGVMTNCFLAASEFERHIQNGSVFYHAKDDALIILLRLQSHDRLYYYIKEGGSPPHLKLTRPTVMEIARRDEYQARASLLWQSVGFNIVIRRVRMECINPAQTSPGNNGVYVASREQEEEIMNMLQAGFDSLTGCIPTMDELAASVAREEFLCIEENGEMLGLLQYRNDKATSEILHLFVKAEGRGRGLADRLVNYYKGQATSLNKRLRVWANENNMRARAFYEKNGYRCDGLSSDVLLAVK